VDRAGGHGVLKVVEVFGGLGEVLAQSLVARGIGGFNPLNNMLGARVEIGLVS
jgi:hypothetical protein